MQLSLVVVFFFEPVNLSVNLENQVRLQRTKVCDVRTEGNLPPEFHSGAAAIPECGPKFEFSRSLSASQESGEEQLFRPGMQLIWWLQRCHSRKS